MLYKIYYELKNGKVDFFLMNNNNDDEMVKHQVKLRQGKFLKCEEVRNIKTK